MRSIFFFKIYHIKGKGNLEHKATKYNPWNTRMLLHAHSTLETSFQYHTNSYPCFTKTKHMDANFSIISLQEAYEYGDSGDADEGDMCSFQWGWWCPPP